MAKNNIYVCVPYSSANGDAFEDNNYITSVYGSSTYKVLKYVAQGVSFIEEFDGQLDQCTLNYFSPNSRKIPQYTPVRLIIRHYDDEADSYFNTVYDFVVSSDTSVKQSLYDSLFKYTHVLSLIEPTVYLEKFTLPAHGNTRKYNKAGADATIADQINDELELARGPRPAGNNVIIDRFYLTSSEKNKFSNKPAEEFFYDSPPLLREVLDDMYRTINSRVRIDKISSYDSIAISSKSFNTNRDDSISLPINTNVNSSTPGFDKLAKNLEVHGKNAISSNREVVVTDWDTFKSTDGSATLTTDNMGIVTQHPIEKITKFEINLVMNVTGPVVASTNNIISTIVSWVSGSSINVLQWFADLLAEGDTDAVTSFSYTLGSLDLTEYLYEEEEYNKLTENEKLKALKYTKGSYSSNVGKYQEVVFFPVVAMTYIIKDKLSQDYADGVFDSSSVAYKVLNWATDLVNKVNTWIEGLNNSISTLFGIFDDYSNCSTYDINDMMYRIEYVPYINPHAKFTKDNAFDTLPETTQLDNQSEKSIDVLRFGEVEKSKVNVLGNSSININCLATIPSDLIEPGTVINSGALCCTGREYAVYANFIEVAYKFEADYQAIRGRTQIDRERRVYEIPLASDQIDRQILLKNFIQISDEAITCNEQVLYPGFVLNLFSTWFDQSGKPLKYVILRTYSSVNDGVHYESIPGPYQLTVARYAMATSMLFSFNTYDNYSAGLGTGSRVVGGNEVLLNRYVNQYTGRYDQFKCILAASRTDTWSNRSTYLNKLRNLPLIDDSVFSYDEAQEGITYFYPKDAFDHDMFTCQYEFVSNKKYIFIGNKIAQLNGLMETEASETLYLWYSSYNTYSKNAKTCLGSRLGTLVNAQSAGYIDVDCVDDQVYIEVTRTHTLATAKSWAIGTRSGELILAYNVQDEDSNSDKIYFASSFERQYNEDTSYSDGYTVHYVDTSGNYPGDDFPSDAYNLTVLPTLPTLSSPLVTFTGWEYLTYENGEYTRTGVYARAGDELTEDVYLKAVYLLNGIIEI